MIDYDFHALSAQNIGGAHEYGVAEFLCYGTSLVRTRDYVKGRIGNSVVVKQGREASAVFGKVQGLVGGPDNGNPKTIKLFRELKSRLAPELNDNTHRFLVPYDVVNMLPENRLKVELVGGVEIRGYRLWIAVNHDGFKAFFFGRQHPVHAAVVKLNSLANAVGPTAQHNDLFAVARHTVILGCQGAKAS